MKDERILPRNETRTWKERDMMLEWRRERLEKDKNKTKIKREKIEMNEKKREIREFVKD